MNHQPQTLALIEAIKNDKTSNPKWRNKIVSRLEEIEAMLHKLSAREMTKAEMESLASTQANEELTAGSCTCIPGAVDTTCPVHGV